MLFFLDLSAGFDTVNHQVLFLSDRFGITGSALSLSESYPQGRTQFVHQQHKIFPSRRDV